MNHETKGKKDFYPGSDKYGTIIDVYETVHRIALEEIHPDIDFHWYAKWDDFLSVGNFFTRPDHYDLVEIALRLEETFGIKISDQDAENMITVRDTILFLWKAIN